MSSKNAKSKKAELITFLQENKKEMIAAVSMAIVLLVSGIIVGCKLWQMIPLFVSTLVVMTLQMKANRYMFIVGGCNATIGYTLVYLSQGLYAAAAYSFLCSGPVQFITFYLWNKKAYKHSSRLKRLSKKQILWIAIGAIAVWCVMYFIFSLLGSPYLLLDNTFSLVGILGTVLSMLSYLEYTIISVVGSLSSIFMYINVVADQPDQIPHLLYAIYCAITTFISFRYMRKLYKQQQEADTNEEIVSH